MDEKNESKIEETPAVDFMSTETGPTQSNSKKMGRKALVCSRTLSQLD